MLVASITTENVDGYIENLSHAADACDLKTFYLRNGNIPTEVIFFQCPWGRNARDVPGLLRGFIKSAKDVQVPGDFLVLGLDRKSVV